VIRCGDDNPGCTEIDSEPHLARIAGFEGITN
jgi:hypothetical protein